jgi:hypothetical protein
MNEQAYSTSESPSPIQQGAADQLSMELARFGELLDRLETILKPALRPPSPEEAPRDKPTTSDLRMGVYHFSDLNSRLSGLIERVDV